MGRIRIGKAEAPFSTKTKIQVSLWDTHSGRALGKSREATELNRRLDTMNVIIHSRYRELLKTKEGVTAKQIKAAFQGIAFRQATLIAYFEDYVNKYRERVGKDRKKSTFRELQNAMDHVSRFLKRKYKLSDIPFSALTYTFIEDYDYHLRIKLKLQSGTILNLISRLRRMVTYAVNEGLISNDPFFGYKPVYPKAKQKYLTLSELESIIHMPFSDDRLCLTGDLFVFACFTGLAYADLCNLSEEHLTTGEDGKPWICIERQKSKTECYIPLMKLPLQIMEKYRSERKAKKLFKTVSSGYLAVCFRKLKTLCNVKHMTFHCLRHRESFNQMYFSVLQD
jgi:site-specific recombinase XerD